jgi:hypothetical protein
MECSRRSSFAHLTDALARADATPEEGEPFDRALEELELALCVPRTLSALMR